jgi:hypothetical protein
VTVLHNQLPVFPAWAATVPTSTRRHSQNLYPGRFRLDAVRPAPIGD